MKKTFLILLALLLCAPLIPLAAADDLRVDFFDMGKADAMLITTPSGVRILIDCGTNKGGKALVERFHAAGIREIDTLIITHYDKDHVGGADKILEELAVRQVIMPIYDKESKQYEQFTQALGSVQTFPLAIGADMAMQSGDGVTMTVTAAHQSSYGKDEENDFSLAVRLRYGDTRFFFPGDAEAPRQRELLEEGDVACDVLKTPYHGRLTEASEDFLTEAAPKIAYITDSDEEPASEAVVALLQSLGTQVFCAKDDGSIAVTSDGNSVKVVQ